MHFFRQVRWGGSLLAVLLLGSGRVGLRAAEPVFAGPSAEYEQVPPLTPAAEATVLRWIWVEERMGRARAGAPVRVPVFFYAGECREPDEVTVVRWPSQEPVPVQADDVRRGTDGGVARMHLWFATDLAAGETQRWALVRRSGARPPANRALVPAVTADRVTLQAGGTTVEFLTQAPVAGGLAALRLADGPELTFAAGAVPVVVDAKAAAAPAPTPASAAATVQWGSGPIFAKVAIGRPGAGITVTQNYRLFADGSLNLIQTITAANGLPALSGQNFLGGELGASAGLQVLPQPAGIVDGLENFHPGYAVDVLAQKDRPRGWLVMPGTIGGTAGRLTVADGRLALHAPANFLAGQSSQRAYWSEVTLYPAERGAWRPVLLTASQPLVGVVERPGLTRDQAAGRVADNVREMKPVGWVNETVIRSLQGRADLFPRRRWSVEAQPEHWVAAAQRATAKLTSDGTALREDEKGRAAGPLDPYHITYGSTALVPWLRTNSVPAPALASLRAQLEAVRRQLGRTDAEGQPYLDVFNRAQNMQMGPPLLALADAGLDPDLRHYYRGLLEAPALRAVLPRGVRPYEGRPQARPNESDTIYQAVVDFLLRAAELETGENLGLQRVAYGRYLDAIDVTADQFHPAHPRSADDAQHFARANFFRAQSHQHRWLSWGPAPFLALLRPATDTGDTVGATEAWYFADQLAGRWKNWPDQSWLYLAAELAPPDAVAVKSRAARPAR